jgi:hypothetical protein
MSRRRLHRQSDSTTPARATRQTAPTPAPHYTLDISQRLNAEDILQLQRQIGNAAVIQLLNGQNPASAPKTSVQRLPDPLNEPLEKLFGESMGDVPIHTDAHADHLARAANTDAVAHDGAIYFRQGAYRPGTQAGNAVIAREATHIARGKMTGAAQRKPGASDRREADEIADIVGTMDANPAQTLQPVQGEPTPAQQRLIQRNGDKGYSHSRVAGIVVSKTLQGIGNLLGPIGILWRWPVIRKNIREYTATMGKDDDKNIQRYGEGSWANFARFIASFAEIVKEMTTWMGFITFLTAIITLATQGMTTPVMVIMGGITAGLALLGVALKSYLVIHNLVRLARAKQGTNTAMIRHQLFTDGFDLLANVVTAITSTLGAVGMGIKLDGGSPSFSGSPGGAIAKPIGDEVLKTGVGKLVGDPLNAMIGIPGTVGKEGGKDYTKPGDKKEGWKQFKAGFLKDNTEIQNAYKELGKKKEDTSGGASPKDLQTLDQVSQQVSDIVIGLGKSTGDTSLGKSNALDSQKKIDDIDLGEVKDKTDEMEDDSTEAGELSKNNQNAVDKKIDELPESQINKVAEDVKKGENEVDGDSLESQSKKNDNLDPNNAQFKGEKPGIGSRLKMWFQKKLSGIKRGVRRMNAKLVRFIFKLVGRFGKGKEYVAGAQRGLAETKMAINKDVALETQNLETAKEMQSQMTAAAQQFEQGKKEEA